MNTPRLSAMLHHFIDRPRFNSSDTMIYEVIESIAALIVEILTFLIIAVTFAVQSIAIYLAVVTASIVFYQSIVSFTAALLYRFLMAIDNILIHSANHSIYRILSMALGINVLNLVTVWLWLPSNTSQWLHSAVDDNRYSELLSILMISFAMQLVHEFFQALITIISNQNLSQIVKTYVYIGSFISFMIPLIILFKYENYSINHVIEFSLLYKGPIEASINHLKALCSSSKHEDLLLSSAVPFLFDSLRQIIPLITIGLILFYWTEDKSKESTARYVLWCIIISQYILSLIHSLGSFMIHFMFNMRLSSLLQPISLSELRELSSDDVCPICLSDHNSTSRRLPCGHLIHLSCAARMMIQSSSGNPGAGFDRFRNIHRCPVCRYEFFDSFRQSDQSNPSTSISGASVPPPMPMDGHGSMSNYQVDESQLRSLIHQFHPADGSNPILRGGYGSGPALVRIEIRSINSNVPPSGQSSFRSMNYYAVPSSGHLPARSSTTLRRTRPDLEEESIPPSIRMVAPSSSSGPSQRSNPPQDNPSTYPLSDEGDDQRRAQDVDGDLIDHLPPCLSPPLSDTSSLVSCESKTYEVIGADGPISSDSTESIEVERTIDDAMNEGPSESIPETGPSSSSSEDIDTQLTKRKRVRQETLSTNDDIAMSPDQGTIQTMRKRPKKVKQ